MAIYTEDQIEDGSALADYNTTRQGVADRLFDAPLTNNPTTTWGDTVGMRELLQVAPRGNSLLRDKRAELFTEDEIATMENAAQRTIDNRVTPYNIPPYDLPVDEIYPEYTRRQKNFEERGPATVWRVDEAAARTFGKGFDPQDLLSDPGQGEPKKPWGFDRAEEIGKRGVNPFNELAFNDGSSLDFDLSLLNFRSPNFITNIFPVPNSDASKYAWLSGLAPRNKTVADEQKLLLDTLGLEGKISFIDPKTPELGMRFLPEGSEEYQTINAPGLGLEDIGVFLAQEGPALLGEIAATRYLGKKVSPGKRGYTGNMFERGGKITLLGALTGAGAAGGDFLRLALGAKLGAHDRDFTEVMKESGVTGLWAMGGTAVISSLAMALPSVWTTLTGKNVPEEYWAELEETFKAAKRADSPSPGLAMGEGISIDDVKGQLDYLRENYADYFADIKPFGLRLDTLYEPTTEAAAATRLSADLTAKFLKMAEDPALQQLHLGIKNGNQEIIDAYVNIVSEEIGPALRTAENVTGATLQRGINEVAQQQVDVVGREMRQVIDDIRGVIGGAEDAATAGQALTRQTVNESISTPLFPRITTRLNQLVEQVKLRGRTSFNAALENPLYKDTTTGAKYTTTPLRAWFKERSREAGELFRSVESNSAVGDLYNMIPKGDKSTLLRLMGRDTSGKWANPEFTLDQLNSARLSLSEFSGKLQNQPRAFRLAKDLEAGLEEQMHELVRTAASKHSGIPLTSEVKLNKYIEENQYGHDLRDAWTEQLATSKLANSQVIRSILDSERPEKVAEYLFSTTAKGTSVNTPVDQLMDLLRQEGDGTEIFELKEGLAGFIQREILDSGDAPLIIARSLRQFANTHEGVLKSVFGDEYVKRFRTLDTFEDQVIAPLKAQERKIATLRSRFGLDPASENKGVGDIIGSVLAKTNDPQAVRSGFILEDVEMLVDLVKDNPDLQEQMAVVTKRYLIQDILGSRQGPGSALDPAKLDNLLTGGFGPSQVSGQRLTFESLIEPLLGDAGPEFVKNLRILNNLAKRELGPEISQDLALKLGPGGAGSEGLVDVKLLQRLFMSPLDVRSRRVTAITSRAARNSSKFIGNMLLDEELFENSMKFATGRMSRQNFIRYLTASTIVSARDIGNELKYYDTEDKVQRPAPERTVTDQARDDLAALQNEAREIPNRVLELAMGYGGAD